VKLVKPKRDIMNSIPSSFVEDKPVDVDRAKVIREVAISEVQTEAMEGEEEAAFIESDLEQYELCGRLFQWRNMLMNATLMFCLTK
jgi:hypothetical protein